MFRLAVDNDSHWYVIPVVKSAEWEAWTDLDPDDATAWTPPTWAVELNGSPTHVQFPSWEQK